MKLLDIQNLSIRFGGLQAVDNVNLSIEKGQLYGLIGPNGAGKTTLFNMLTGVYKPTGGKIYLDGADITGQSPLHISRAGVGRTFQNIRLFANMSAIDNVKAVMGTQNPCSLASSLLRLPSYKKSEEQMQKRAYELLKVFDLHDLADTLSVNLPYGKQRKLEIARALATDPKLLLLDEPAAGMNPGETLELMQTIALVQKEFGVSILLIEHDMSLVSGICKQLTVLNFGQVLAQGDTKQVLQDPRVIEAYLGQ